MCHLDCKSHLFHPNYLQVQFLLVYQHNILKFAVFHLSPTFKQMLFTASLQSAHLLGRVVYLMQINHLAHKRVISCQKLFIIPTQKLFIAMTFQHYLQKSTNMCYAQTTYQWLTFLFFFSLRDSKYAMWDFYFYHQTNMSIHFAVQKLYLTHLDRPFMT